MNSGLAQTTDANTGTAGHLDEVSGILQHKLSNVPPTYNENLNTSSLPPAIVSSSTNDESVAQEGSGGTSACKIDTQDVMESMCGH